MAFLVRITPPPGHKLCTQLECFIPAVSSTNTPTSPVPQPRKRDTLLEKARASYETVATKLGETAAYPGNWLYETWSDSDLKEWLDTNGFPAPQPTTVSDFHSQTLSSVTCKEYPSVLEWKLTRGLLLPP